MCAPLLVYMSRVYKWEGEVSGGGLFILEMVLFTIYNKK